MRAKRWFCLAVLLTACVAITVLAVYTSVLWSAEARRPLSIFTRRLARLIDRKPAPLPQIPRIIHQTWKNDTVPARWENARLSCIALHPVDAGWEHRLWTDESARAFIAAEYPHLLATFDSYPYNIQRADSMRYIFLYHFGGIYMDLDVGCMRSLGPLLAYPAVLPNTNPAGFSNDFMMARPRHPFFRHVIEALPRWNHWYPGPWLTIFFSAGPPFLSLQYIPYMHKLLGGTLPAPLKSMAATMHPDLVYNMERELYEATPECLFAHYTGNSWHQWDSVLISIIVTHLSWRLSLLVLSTLVAVWFVCVWMVRRVWRRGAGSRQIK